MENSVCNLHTQALSNEELGHVAQAGQSQETAGGHYSDTTASAAGSDDEGSTAATDGSTLRTSPAEQAGSAAGSESGGSESITGEHINVSGRSSAYGDQIIGEILPPPAAMSQCPTNQNADSSDQQEVEIDSENGGRLHVLRLQLLERLTEYLPKLRGVNGVRAVPFLQVVLQLSGDLDGHSERDRTCFHSLLTAVIIELQLNQSNTDVCQRTNEKEVQLVLMKLLSVFMGRCKTTSTTLPSTSSTTSKTFIENSTFVSRTTATVLHKANIISYCNNLLRAFLTYWTKTNPAEDTKTNSISGGKLLKEHSTKSPPDMTPFFTKQCVKENGTDVFATYPEILTEMALRLPYQVHKYSEITEPIATAFDDTWYEYLCEYMMTSQAPSVRRQVRKLLLFICGNKEKYRHYRDVHALKKHVKGVFRCCLKGGYENLTDVKHSLCLTYDVMVDLVEHLKACVEIAVNRTGNWQKFCIKEDTVIALLILLSCLLDEGVAPTILHLLQCAIANGGVAKKSVEHKGTAGGRKDREKSDDSATEAIFEEANCGVLVEQINKQVNKEIFAKFIRIFMLETNTTSIRWQAHALILAIYK